MVKNMSDLPKDMEEEVLSRVPLTSLRRVRSTCKKWNTLSKDRSFTKKHFGYQSKVAAEAKEFMVVALMDFRVYLMRVNLYNNNVESCIKPEARLISIDGSDEVDVSQVFHCEGLVLCVMKDNGRLMVWNPYLGQTRWLEPSYNFSRVDEYSYALGYDKRSKSHKVLVFIDFNVGRSNACVEFIIYDFNSDSWRVLDVTPDGWEIFPHYRGVSLKGNTYWFVRNCIIGVNDTFLVCFDFTRETFGPRLRLPVPIIPRNLTLSSVREEQLAILFQRWDSEHMEIWITSKIEPNAVSWNSKVFLEVNIRPLICFDFHFSLTYDVSFFVDEEKKAAVVFVKRINKDNPNPNAAYIVGVDGSLKEAHLGESAFRSCDPRVCSYVPSLVKL